MAQETFKIRVECRFKTGILDPEGNFTLLTLQQMASRSDDAQVRPLSLTRARVFIIDVAAKSLPAALKQAEKWANEMLANTVIEDFTLSEEQQ